MAATSTRSPPNAYTFYDADSPQLQRRVSKKSSRSSFLSLKRNKKSVSSIDTALPAASPTPGQSHPGNEFVSSAYHGFQDPAEVLLSAMSSRSDHSRRSSRSASSKQDQASLHSAQSSERQRSKKKATPSQLESQPFPVIGGHESSLPDDRHGRRRSSRSQRQVGSCPDDFEELVFRRRPFNISLVDSASSVLSHYDTPQTPVDDLLFRDLVYSLPVVVAAPTSGVETMDALVDGMNDGFGDDHFTGSGGLSGRKKISKSGHHPLYHPPLPKPPPGVVLGKVGQPSTPPRSPDSDEDDDKEDKTVAPVRSWSEQREHRKKRRPGSSRGSPSTASAAHPVYPSRPASALSTPSTRFSPSAASSAQVVSPRPGSSVSISSVSSLPSTSTTTPTNDSFEPKCHETPATQASPFGSVSAESITSTPNSSAFATPSHGAYALRTATSSFTYAQDGAYNSPSPSRTVAPSISEIIRAHAPPAQRTRSRKSSYAHSFGHETVHEQPEPSPRTVQATGEADMISRSSVDTIAEEVQRTIEKIPTANAFHRPLHASRSFPRLPTSQLETRAITSTRSEGRRESSIFSYSTTSDQPPAPDFDLSTLTKPPTKSPSQAIAEYLRSARLTRLLQLTRFPHASQDHPLTVSLSDLGSPAGYPVIVFLGLGCVRHIMGLYDEMAECLGIRLITIDRWGLGRTDNARTKTARGIPEWAFVVEEVLDRLKIDQCSVMAHSAGAPYALAFANKYPERIRGEVCLLAPWVGGGEGAGYKWLKYVPNGILKTAQAAEWKIQAWMIGKPPTFQFEGIGFDASSPVSSPVAPKGTPTSPTPASRVVSASSRKSTSHLDASHEAEPRLSLSSIALSDYDDLRDFDGRFESRTSLGRKSTHSDPNPTEVELNKSVQRKPSRGFLGRLKTGQAQLPQDGRRGGTKLKVLRSMGSLKGKKATHSPVIEVPPVPRLPLLLPQEDTDVGLGLDNIGLDGLGLSEIIRAKSISTPPTATAATSTNPSFDFSVDVVSSLSRASGRRSISLGVVERSVQSTPSPLYSPLSEVDSTPASFQAMLGNALVAASHAESAKGTHRDLVQILNHDRQPWGFSYAAYPHIVRVWYGDRDERIAENAVRWMENTMGCDKCLVKVIEGADHALMYKSSVVIEVLEKITDFWRDRD